GPDRVVDPRGGGGAPFFSPGCKRIISQDPTTFALHVQDVASGAVVTRAGPAALIRGNAFSPDGRQFLTVELDGVVRLWDLERGTSRVVARQNGQVDVGAVVVSADGRFCAVGDRKGDLGVYEFATGSWRSVHAHHGTVPALAFSADGTLLASGGG